MKIQENKMRIRDEELWQKGLENNSDPYGQAIYRYAENWANLMEEAIEDGKELVKVAKQLSHDADDEGITGFMYGAAVNVLAGVWYLGEELRKWHNLDTQIGNEGELANEKGTVLNPAILSVGV